jgi:predicted RNase H-related nuclease YkuK (DUF458 family)
MTFPAFQFGQYEYHTTSFCVTRENGIPKFSGTRQLKVIKRHVTVVAELRQRLILEQMHSLCNAKKIIAVKQCRSLVVHWLLDQWQENVGQ